MWRKTIALLPLFLLAFSPVFSAENSPENAPPEHVKVYIEGKECELSPPAVIRDGRTMVSLRSLSEALGAEIEWCEVNRVARAYLEDGAALNGDEGFASASYAENSAAPDGEGDFEPQDASGENAACDSARIIDGRIYVSLRSAAESFGYDVSWDSTNHAALLRENREKEHVAGFLSVDADLAEVETDEEEEICEHGEYLCWSKARHIYTRGSTATVTDVRTGLTFQVKRRGGTNHADSEPLKAADTAIMNRAYGSSWSWTPRPILVSVHGRDIAASMNGMPHGGQFIYGNNFPGHFCIHFKNSRTHNTNSISSRHQAAVIEAAGIN